MKKRNIFVIFFLLTVNITAGQFQEKKNMAYKNASYTVFKVKIDTGVTKNLRIEENKGKLNEADFFAQTTAASPVYFAITAGIVDSTCTPLGLYIKNGQTVKDINQDKGDGNFFLMPPNGYLAISDSTAVVAASTSYKPGMAYKMAIQSGPMLVRDGNMNTFPKDSKNKNIRCGVGISVEKGASYLVFIKSLTPVSFYQLATVFIDKFQCRNALNLESGPNCSLHLPNISVTYRTNVSVCNYIVLTL